ncbi:anion transporter [Thioalkalivibrio denitrificans]|uniref:Anion transporter n=1 Tax=Thioalkalivibrio denitrificans TaxID=108003 RepID=A0A1V3NRC3_9GAMM|nr:DASS family sodium-coupled anion symporter [Thioalkalivibrio denitrificans]OOG27647.1 anion transporter [Thioalkalivibrio denitrificans]
MSDASSTPPPAETPPPPPWRQRLGLVLGPALVVIMIWTGPPGEVPLPAWQVAGLTVLMATWWVTEAVPIPVTALLPVALLPLLGVSDIAEAAAPYANPLIFLFLGGFVIALGLQRWNLHKRIALWILGATGQRLDQLVGGFMAATAGLSMWVSNTATAALMLPIGISVLVLLEDQGITEAEGRNFAVALLLGIAFAANIGGMATLIGTPPNALLAGYLNDHHDMNIGFVQWIAVGLPVSLLLLGICWWVLCRWAFPLARRRVDGIDSLIRHQHEALGPVSGPERRVAVVFAAVALAWLTRPLLDKAIPGLSLTDPGIAILGALALFLIPAGGGRRTNLLDWEATQHLPWGVLVLVGGGLSLGTAIGSSGLSDTVAVALGGLAGFPVAIVVLMVALSAMLLSHVTSNTATAATLLPLAAALALTLGQHPVLLTVPVALAASCAFMLPVATPPNAIVFGSGRITVPDMVHAGWRLSLLSLVVVTVAVLVLAEWILV